VTVGDVPPDGGAHADLEIVWMRTEHEKVEAHQASIPTDVAQLRSGAEILLRAGRAEMPCWTKGALTR